MIIENQNKKTKKNNLFSFIKVQGAGILLDMFAIAGVVMLAYGLWLIYPPAMFIIIGALFMCFSFYGVRVKLRPKNPTGGVK